MGSLALPPSITSVLLNIGSNLQPLLPPDDDPSTASVAFEPVVHSLIPERARLYVVPAAVSNHSGLMTMGVYNKNGLSSSLSPPANAGKKEWSSHGPSKIIAVPTLSLSAVLRSILQTADLANGTPARTIWLLKTDIQGHDFATLQSVGAKIRSVPYVMAESWVEGSSSYAGVVNSYCDHHLPHFLSLGYVPRGVALPRGKWLVAPAGGAEAAQHYCERSAERSRRRRTAGLAPLVDMEANAFFQLGETPTRPPPPHSAASWPPWYLLPGAKRCGQCAADDLMFVNGSYARSELKSALVDFDLKGNLRVLGGGGGGGGSGV